MFVDTQPEDRLIEPFVFARWTNHLRWLLPIGVVMGTVYLILMAAYGASPRTLEVGYAPVQPVAFSHALHAGELELDCRYCHAFEDSAHAALPTTETCFTCHRYLKTYTEAFRPILDSSGAGRPVPWVRVHDLPDYVHFDHRIHVHRGIACTTCHGRVFEMEVVRQVEPLSMAWCLECHRHPERYVQPLPTLADRDWDPGEDQLDIGTFMVAKMDIEPSTDCSSCHR